MSQPFLAEIRCVGFNFAPTGWATCDGQLLPISQNTALFSLLGTYYGGDGKSTFGLPDLQGSVPVSTGNNGFHDYALGETGGSDTVTLLDAEMTAHPHGLEYSTQPALARQPGGQLFAVATGIGLYGPNSGQTTTMSPFALSVAGNSQPHNNMMPFITLLFIIALQGVFPPRP